MTALLSILAAGLMALPSAQYIAVQPKRPDFFTVYIRTNFPQYTIKTNFPGTNTVGVVTNFVKGQTNWFALSQTISNSESFFSADTEFFATNGTRTVMLTWIPALTNLVTVGVSIRSFSNLQSSARTPVYQTNWVTLANPTPEVAFFDAVVTVTNK